MDKPGIPKAKPKKEPWREVTKKIVHMPVKSQTFTGTVIVIENVPLCRIGFTTTRMGSALTQGMPVLVPVGSSAPRAPEFILKMTNKEMRCWVRGEKKRIIVPTS